MRKFSTIIILLFLCCFSFAAIVSADATWSERRPDGDVDHTWSMMSTSANGQLIFVGANNGRLYLSSDSGVNWTETQPAGNADQTWAKISMSADGQVLLAAISNGRVYLSTNGGTSWSETQPAGNVNKNWSDASVSEDGSKLTASSLGGRLYISTNQGASWAETRPVGNVNKNWQLFKMSGDGQTLVAAIDSGRVYLSTNGGTSWAETQPKGNVNGGWNTAAVSSNGTTILIVTYDSRVYLSTNNGTSWAETLPGGGINAYWRVAAMSGDGQTMLAGYQNGRLYLSTNGGTTWAETQPDGNANKLWFGGAISKDGGKLVAGNFRLFVGTLPVPSPVPSPSPSPAPTPSIGFSASSFKVKKGETVTLSWNSSNLTSLSLSPGNSTLNVPNGDFYVHPDTTTEYTINGTGPYGDATHSITVTVEGELAASPDPNATPSPSPSVSPSQSPSALLSSRYSAGSSAIASPSPTATGSAVLETEETPISSPTPTDIRLAEEAAQEKEDLHTEEVAQKEFEETLSQSPAFFRDFVNQVIEVLPQARPLIRATIKNAKPLSRTGLVLGATTETALVGLVVATAAAQGSIASILNVRTLFNSLRTVGFVPFKKRKGFIHATGSGIPIPFAAITVYESGKQAGAPFVTLVSDMYGAYFEPYLPKGKYVFVATHDQNAFPTRLDRSFHLSVKDFYKGEEITVHSNKDQQAVLIPMDPKKTISGKFLKTKLLLALSLVLNWLQWTMYPLFVLSIISVLTTPNVVTFTVLFIYTMIVVSQLKSMLVWPSLTGTLVLKAAKNKPIENANLILSNTDGNTVGVSRSDRNGRFTFFVPQGKYALNVILNTYVWNDVKMGTQYDVKVGRTPQNLKLSMSSLAQSGADSNVDWFAAAR